MGRNRSRNKSRKETRKEARKAKKQRRNEYYARQGKRKLEEASKANEKKNDAVKHESENVKKFRTLKEEQDIEIKKERDMKKKLDKEIRKKRIERLMEDNVKEEKEIKKLEKQLKFRKGKRSGAFALDGLDFVLDVCDKKVSCNEGERVFKESDDGFESDLSTVAGNKNTKSGKEIQGNEDFSDSNDTDMFNESDKKDEDARDSSLDNNTYKKKIKKKPVEVLVEKSKVNIVSKGNFKVLNNVQSDVESSGEIDNESNNEIEVPPQKKAETSDDVKIQQTDKEMTEILNMDEVSVKAGKNINKLGNKPVQIVKKKQSAFSPENDKNNNESSGDVLDKSDNVQENNSKDSETWEDIYGRTRDKDGNVISTYNPNLRKVHSKDEASKNEETLLRLRRQLKGLLNRLAENNMASISCQIEQLYMCHSRNEINEALRDQLSAVIVTEVWTSERLIAEHAMLVAILHTNVGSEIGTYFLQYFVNKFVKMLQEDIPVEDKRINNLLAFIMHLYNFRVFHSKLMYDITHELLTNLKEKQVELLLMILRTVGFAMRKNNPLAMKSLILKIQERVYTLKSCNHNLTRMTYMLEIVMAIKNNNVSKIPNCNIELMEHFKKCMKVLTRKENSNAELYITLLDLLNAEKQGRWWVVGSAWSGSGPSDNASDVKKSKHFSSDKLYFSQKLLDLAKKQRMNTGVRRNVFCILMSAEDYLDAFEKLLKLRLKGVAEREMLNVLLHCSLQEHDFNPYYFHLAVKFCTFHRKYQIMLHYAAWDKMKELNSLSPVQLSNFATFLGKVISNRILSLAVVKVITLIKMDNISMKFLRLVLLTILLNHKETVVNAFSRIVISPKLKDFREGIRLFIHHFLLKKVENRSDEKSVYLKKKIEIAFNVLTSSDLKTVF